MGEDSAAVPSAEEIAGLRLPEAAAELVDDYERRIGHRPEFLWKWLYEAFPRYRLSSVPDRYHEAVREQKLLLTIFYTLLDDLADLHGDRETFIAARRLTFEGADVDESRPAVDADYLTLARRAWTSVDERLQDAPRVGAFRPVFAFDLQQPLNAMHYGCLVSERPPVVTEAGLRSYDEHNMAQFSYADIDILFSPSFRVGDLRPLRSVVWRAQRLARISNWVATWERELDERDPTSGVVVRALADGVLTTDELVDPAVPSEDLAERIRDHDVEDDLLEEWDRLYEDLRNPSRGADSVDLSAYVSGMKEMRDLYLAYRDRL